ncbi:MAG: peptidase M17, partial [Chryseobacterium sp.]
MKNFILSFVAGLLSLTLTAQNTTPVGTSKNWGSVDGISMIGLVQGPSSADAQLQVACVFEYTENDIHSAQALPANLNGLVHLDEALKGEFT